MTFKVQENKGFENALNNEAISSFLDYYSTIKLLLLFKFYWNGKYKFNTVWIKFFSIISA